MTIAHTTGSGTERSEGAAAVPVLSSSLGSFEWRR